MWITCLVITVACIAVTLGRGCLTAWSSRSTRNELGVSTTEHDAGQGAGTTWDVRRTPPRQPCGILQLPVLHALRCVREGP